MQPTRLTTPEMAKDFFETHSTGAFFKAGGCHKTMQGYGVVQEALNKWPIPLGVVTVIEHRPTSNFITEITQVVHQSPQLILWVDQKVVFAIDNWDITPKAIDAAFNTHLGKACAPSCTLTEKKLENVDAYRLLLTEFISGNLDENSFTQQWLKTFQLDATLRETAEFNLLNSLFGDVDAALAKGVDGNETLYSRAKELLTQIN